MSNPEQQRDYAENKKVMHAAVNTDPLPLLPTWEVEQTRYRLKERNVLHVKIKDTDELKQIYDFGEQIGQGAFGVVISVTERSTLKKWAMKTVVKTTVGARIKLVQREIQILKLISHPHIILLNKVYETPRKIFMIFEKCYGELAKVYQEQKPFPEHISKKVIKELVEAVAYLHRYDIVHRDLKMENILIGENPNDPRDEFYIKLTDFGLSIVKFGRGIEGMLNEYCGTLLYMSPEMILCHSYSQQCDIWAIGVILYMMSNGDYPFFSRNKQDLLNKICKLEPTYNQEKLSPELIDLLHFLLMKNPVNRLTATEILHHPWVLDTTMALTVKPCNILQVMKEWKSEMMVPGTQGLDLMPQESPRVSEGLLSDEIFDIVNGRQPLPISKTDIKFNRNQNKKDLLKDGATSSKKKNGSNNHQIINKTRKNT